MNVLRVMALAGAVVSIDVDAGAMMEVRFENVYGETRALAREEQRWINPAGPLRVRVGAELGAVVTATITGLDDQVVTQAASPRLDSNDWIVFEGVWTIGTVVSLPVPREDGEYRLRVETRDATDAVIDSTVQGLKIDRSAPQMTGSWRYRGDLMLSGDRVTPAMEGVALPEGAAMAWSADGEISVSGIRDTASGVVSVQFFTRHDAVPLHSDLTSDLAARYDPVTGTASISRLFGDEGNLMREDLADVEGIGFALVDAAGNRAEFVRSAHLVTGCDVRGVEVDIKTSDDAAWRPHDLDAPVAPEIRWARVRVPRGDSALEDPVRGVAGAAPDAPGTRSWPPEPTSRDARFDAYEIPLDAGPRTLRELVRSATHTRCSTPPPTGIVGLTLHLEGGVQRTWTRRDARSAAAVVAFSGEERMTGVTLSVLPSEEEQIAGLGDTQCTIPAHATQCSVDLRLEPGAPENAGGLRLPATVRASAHAQAHSQAQLEVVLLVDRIKPDIVGHGFSRDELSLLLDIAEAPTGGFAGASGLSETWVDAEGDDGTVHRLEGTWERGVGDGFRGRVALSDLPQGRYRLTAYTRDTSGNLARPRPIAEYVRDRTAPRVALHHGAAALDGASVASLDAVQVSSDEDARVTSLLLSGGPDGARIGLVGYAGPEGIRPGFVPLRPSSAKGDYTLTASVTDAQGNLSTHAASFTYAPSVASLEGDGVLRIADIGVPLKGLDGEWPLRTTELTRWWSGGAPIRGRHDVSVALSPDARGSLQVGSLVLGPGERGVIADYDFDAARQRIALPVAPSAPIAPDASDGVFGTLMLRTDLDDVPAIAMPVRLFDAGVGMEAVELAQAEGGHGAANVRIGLRVLDRDTCGEGVLLAHGTGAASPQEPGAVRCALRWDAFPGWLALDPSTGMLSGRRPDGDEAGAAVYQPGFLIGQEQAPARFEPSGAPRTLALRQPPASRHLQRLIPAGAANRPWAALSGWLWDHWGGADLMAEAAGVRVGQEIVIETDEGAQIVSTSPSIRSGFSRTGVLIERRAQASTACQRAFIRGDTEGGEAAGPELCLMDREELVVLAVDAATFDDSTGETRLTGLVGTALDGGGALRPAEDGAWRIEISAIGVSGDAVQTPALATETGPDGQWSIGLGRLGHGGARLRVVATALDVGPEGACDSPSVELPPMSANGAAIAGRVHRETLEGARGLRQQLSLVLGDRARAGDIGAIQWERSRDAGGTWEALDGERFFTLAVEDRGVLGSTKAAHYRVRIRNAHSGVESVSEVATIADIAIGELYGPADAQRDAAATLTRDITSAAGRSVLWTAWHPASGVTRTIDGALDRASLHLDRAGDWVVGVGPGVDDGGAVRVIRVLDTAVPRLTIEGPERLEIGRVGRYLAGGLAPGRAAWTLRWRMPDGTLREGPEVDYAPRDGDQALVLEATQSADAEPVKVSLAPQLWAYAWPRFSLTSKDGTESAGRVRHYAVTTREVLKTGPEPLQYAWDLPKGAVASGVGELQTVTFAPGVQPRVSVTVSDTRGHAAVLTDAVPDSVADLAADISIVTTDRLARAPTQTLVSWRAQGLREGERVITTRVWVNGALAGASASDQYDIWMEKPGLRQVDVEIVTDRGRSARASGMVEILDGPAPTCRVKVAGDWKTHIDAVADCTVARGEMRGYQWSVEYADDGGVRDFGLRDGRLSLGAAHLERGVREIRLIGYDDRGVASAEARRRRNAALHP